jgi:hypothetical protein
MRFSNSSFGDRSGNRDAHEPSFALGGKRKTRANVVAGELREIGEQFLLGHAGREVRQHVAHRYSHTANTRLPEPHLGVYDDPIPIIHAQVIGAWLERSKAPAEGSGIRGNLPKASRIEANRRLQ